ncbi:hypothetical protein B0O99DRAFT_539553 [Bisporella sp. PMI_857]|nr:hypothetical protein B0O99DRAFT_539553 [Bisporella sp. PMI_857]
MAATNSGNSTSNTTRLQSNSSFENSYTQWTQYPRNLICQSLYPGALDGYMSRLAENAAKLFKTDGTEIPFRDYTGDANCPNGGWDKQNIYSEGDLKERLGDLSSAIPAGPMVTKKDPNCRLIFFAGTDSREPLNLSKSLLLQILTYHQVMSGFLDFLFIFGKKNAKNETRDLRYSGFREKTMIHSPLNQANAIPQLGRSGRQFELCYNLKTVVCKSDAKEPLLNKEWSIRQGALYHKFDIETGTTLWIVTEGRREKNATQRKDIKQLLQDLVGRQGRPEDRDYSSPETSFCSNLSIHLLACYWSTEQWRWYIEWLEDVIEEKTGQAIHERRPQGGKNYVYTTNEVQSVQYYEDRINEAIMILEANVGILTALREYYQKLLHVKGFNLGKVCKQDIFTFANRVDGMIYDSNMNIERAKVLLKITTDRKNLILQHLQSQAVEKQSEATEKMERLNFSMHKIGTMAQKEAIAMRIITVVTLVFLPATFVSVSRASIFFTEPERQLNALQTLFSTDIIKYQDPQSSVNSNSTQGSKLFMGSFSKIALERWLQVSLPLTALTLIIGYIAFVFATKKAKVKLENLGLLPRYEDEAKAD